MSLVSGKTPKSGQSEHVVDGMDSLSCPPQSSPLPSKQAITHSKNQLPGKAMGVFLVAIISALEGKCLKEPSVSHWTKHEQGCQVKEAGGVLSMEIIQFLSGQFLTYFLCFQALLEQNPCAKIFRGSLEHYQRGKKVFSMEKVKSKIHDLYSLTEFSEVK